MIVRTSTVYNYFGPNKLDISIKSGDKAFAPTWDMVNGYKQGLLSINVYTELYINLMRESFRRNKKYWLELLNREELVVCCYCRPGQFCHRYLFVEILKKLGAFYGIKIFYEGEI